MISPRAKIDGWERELKRGKDFDVFACGHRVLAKRLDDHSGVRDRTRGDGLG
jgi:hypothetical protein